jgi:hypothetical protein
MYLGNGLIAPDVESTLIFGKPEVIPVAEVGRITDGYQMFQPEALPPETVFVTTPWPEPVETLPMPIPTEIAPTKFPMLLAGLGLFALLSKPAPRRRRRK